jgi:hypothetical protein
METWQDLVDVLIDAGQYDSPHTLVRGYPYRVLRVDEANNEFFAALRYHSSEEIRVVKIHKDLGNPSEHSYSLCSSVRKTCSSCRM